MFFFLIFFPRNAYPQFEQFYESWRWAHFTTASGLPSDVVEDVIQSEDGVVWASTYAGLAWYDGYRWNKILNSQGLPEKRASQIAKGINNSIIAIIDGALFVGDTVRFNQVKMGEQFQGKIISAVKLDSSTIIVSTDRNEYPYFLISPEGYKEVELSITGRFFATRNNNVYLANSTGLFKIVNLKPHKILTGCFIRTISDNKYNNTLMIADAPHDMIGIWEWKFNDKPILSTQERLLPIRTIDIASNGNAIAAYETGEIHVKLKHQWINLSPVPTPMIGTLFVKYDDKDNLWVGSEKGLYFYKNISNKWNWIRYKFTSPKNIVMELFKARNGDIWIGHSDGIQILDSLSIIRQINQIDGKNIGLVTGINQDIEGNIWIASGSSFSGAYRWDGRDWKHFGFNEGLKSPRVHKIKKDQKGRLWFLGLGDNRGHLLMKNDPGAFLLADGRFIQYDTSDGLLHNRVYSFVETKDGSIWFGSKFGVNKIKDENSQSFNKKNQINLNNIYSLEVDNNQNVWFSNFTSQLGYIDSKDSIQWMWDWVSGTDYRQKIWDIKKDSRGIMWIASTRGLFSYDNGYWSSYDYESDYKLRELRVVLPLDDKVYVGGHGIGVGILQRNKTGHSIKLMLQKPIIEEGQVHIRWFVDAFWGAMPSENIETRHRLDSGEWSNWTTKKEMVFEKLPDGLHRFEIQSKDIYGNVQKAVNKIHFTVPPPYYKNPIIIAIIGSLFATILFLIYKNINDKIQNEINTRNERINISNDLHDDVGSNLGSISLIGQRAMRNTPISEEVMKELKLITDIAVNTAGELRDIVWYINPQNDSVESLINRMHETVDRQLRDYELEFTIRNDSKNVGLTVGIRHDIMLLFKELVYNITKHSEATRVAILIEHTPESIRLLISDNGKGFDPEKKTAGAGMRSIRRRVERMKGKLTIDTAPGRGTTITVSVNKS